MKEVITQTSAELRVEADAAVAALNEALLDDKHSEIEKAKDAATKTVAKHNQKAMDECMARLRSKDNPMLAAIETMTVPTIALERLKNKDTDAVTYSIEPSTAYIDLLEFEKFCTGQFIAHSAGWKHMVEKFTYLLALREAKKLGVSVEVIKARYHISPEALGIDMGKTPTSNTQMLKGLQAIVDAILYEDNGGKNVYRVTSHDVDFLDDVMSKAGKGAHNIQFATYASARNYILRIMNRIITGASYGMEYKTKKDAAQDAATTKTDDKADAKAKTKTKADAKPLADGKTK